MSALRPGVTRFATRQNARVAYDPGASPPGDGIAPAVVLLHDLLADRTVWGAVRAALAPTYRVIAPDARGHGASASLANRWYTVAELAADVLAVLDAEGIAAAHFVGHGLGGATGVELARRSPDRVRTLALIAPALPALLDSDQDPTARAAATERRSGDRAAADAAYKGLIDQALDRYLIPRRGDDWRGSLAKPRLAAIRRHAPALAALLPALDAYQIDSGDVRSLKQPVFLAPGHDVAFGSRAEQRLLELLPDARLATFAADEAEMPWDQALAPILADWLATVSTGEFA